MQDWGAACDYKKLISILKRISLVSIRLITEQDAGYYHRTKTKQSFRTIEIPEFLKEEIKEFVDGHYGMPDTERLFPVVQEAVQHKMKRQIELAGVKKIRVHDLRHSHVAYLIEKGVEPLLIRDRLGHVKIFPYHIEYLWTSLSKSAEEDCKSCWIMKMQLPDWEKKEMNVEKAKRKSPDKII